MLDRLRAGRIGADDGAFGEIELDRQVARGLRQVIDFEGNGVDPFVGVLEQIGLISLDPCDQRNEYRIGVAGEIRDDRVERVQV